MLNSEITEEVLPLPILMTENDLTSPEKMSSQKIASLIPVQLSMSSSALPRDEKSLNLQIKQCLNKESQDYLKHVENYCTDELACSNPAKYMCNYIFPDVEGGSSDLFNYSPFSPFTLNRCMLASSCLISGIVTAPASCAFFCSIFTCVAHPRCFSLNESFAIGLFGIINSSLNVPFLLAGTALQSSICLIPCLATNALNLATSEKYDALKIASSTSLLFFSHGITLENHLKTLDINSGRNNRQFNEIFFEFNKNDFPNPLQNSHLNSFQYFLNSPHLYLDDVISNQSHFFQERLDKRNLNQLIDNISREERPIIGRIDEYNKIFYTFAFNSFVFNFLSGVQESYPDLIANKKNFDVKKNMHHKNIEKFKEHINKYFDNHPDAMQPLKPKLKDFFDICERYYGRLEIVPNILSEHLGSGVHVQILGYEMNMEKLKLAQTPASPRHTEVVFPNPRDSQFFIPMPIPEEPQSELVFSHEFNQPQSVSRS